MARLGQERQVPHPSGSCPRLCEVLSSGCHTHTGTYVARVSCLSRLGSQVPPSNVPQWARSS